MVDHLDDRRHAARPPRRPAGPRRRRNSTSLEALERLPSLSLSRWMWKGLRSPSGVQRGNRKQEMPPSAWARTRKASHIGAEQNHLWPVELVLGAGPAAVQRRARRRVGADVGAALLLGHRHPAEGAALARRPAASARRSRARGSAAPTRRPARAACAAPGSPSRSSRSGSRPRPRPGTAHEGGAAGDVGAGPGLAPGRGVQAVADADPHQLVPGGVELDLVDAVAVAVVGAQLGRVLVGLDAPADRLPRAADRAELAALGPRPTRRPRGARASPSGRSASKGL